MISKTGKFMTFNFSIYPGSTKTISMIQLM